MTYQQQREMGRYILDFKLSYLSQNDPTDSIKISRLKEILHFVQNIGFEE